MTQKKIQDLIKLERARQDEKFPQDKVKWKGSAYNFTKSAVLLEEVGEVAKACLEGDEENLKEELVQVAAVAIKWLEGLDDNL